MAHPCARYRHLLLCTSLIIVFHVYGNTSYGQSPVDTAPQLHKPDSTLLSDSTSYKQLLKNERRLLLKKLQGGLSDSFPQRKKDSRLPGFPKIAHDSIKPIAVAAGKNMLLSIKQQKRSITESLHALRLSKRDTTPLDIKNPFRKLLFAKPAFRINGGMVAYNVNYRSIIDTPYAEKDIVQHNVTGNLQFTVAGNFPVQVNYWIRQSNSDFFRNIYDVQASFKGNEFRNRLQSNMRERLLALAPAVKDSLLEKLYGIKQTELSGLNNQLKTAFHPQKIIEANEIIKVQKITWDGGLPDSINIQREDSLKKAAAAFLNHYAETKKQYDELTGEVDSLKKEYQKNLQKINRFRQMVNGSWNEMQSARSWKNKLQEYGMEHVEIPAKYRWLSGIKSFSLGRSPVNYSELTAKNISVNGINVEYNSWYYFAATAGTVNYRFRDFVVKGFSRKPQFLYLVRGGIGRLEKNYFILSAFRGQKQLFAGSSSASTIRISGISAESRWALNRSTYITAEVAKSIAPDYRNNPPGAGDKLTFANKNNQAVAFHLFSEVPVTKSKIDVFYKKTGANYQSFSSYTTNAAMESWYIKADQPFFKRKLRIAASIRQNEFSNPFIVQTYKANTIFKSLSATLRVRKWPVISFAYQPLSQLAKAGDQVFENRFQIFNATAFHLYTIKQLRLSTTVMLNKFYNNSSDTGYMFYNATNSYLAQSFFFNTFTANVGASYIKNSSFTLQVLDGGIQPNIPGLGTVGAGIKISNLNHAIIKAGGYVTANIRIHKQDMLFFSYEHGYLPGNARRLVRNEMGTVQFIKTFNFR